MRLHLSHVTGASSTSFHPFLSWIPIVYEVAGLPDGQRAAVGHLEHSWKVLRNAGEPGARWAGAFETPLAALSGLAAEIGADAALPPTEARPHDGVAKQHDDGGWSVYELDAVGVPMFLEGPYDKQKAIERLKVLVSVKNGDQWVMDASGVFSKLN